MILLPKMVFDYLYSLFYKYNLVAVMLLYWDFKQKWVGRFQNTGITFLIYVFAIDHTALTIPDTYLNEICKIIQTTVGNLM